MTIDGVVVTQLKQIADERGKVMHMLKSSDPHFVRFGEIYFSVINPGVIKGWYLHKEMILNYAVPYGSVKLVLFDNRENSSTRKNIQEILLDQDHYCLVTVPPLIWGSFKGVGSDIAIVANCASIPHDPDEIIRKDLHDQSIVYDWAH